MNKVPLVAKVLLVLTVALVMLAPKENEDPRENPVRWAVLVSLVEMEPEDKGVVPVNQVTLVFQDPLELWEKQEHVEQEENGDHPVRGEIPDQLEPLAQVEPKENRAKLVQWETREI